MWDRHPNRYSNLCVNQHISIKDQNTIDKVSANYCYNKSSAVDSKKNQNQGRNEGVRAYEGRDRESVYR